MGLYRRLLCTLLTNAILFALATTIATNTTITQPPPPPPQQPQELHNHSSHTALLAPTHNVERMTSLSFPLHPSRRAQQMQQAPLQPQIMPVRLKEVMQQLRDDGYSFLWQKMNEKFAYLAALDSITVFAVKDEEIKTGSAGYMSSIWLHFVPNHVLMMADLDKLLVGTKFETLERGQFLEVTTSGGTGTAALRINQVEVKNPDLMYNDKIVVHGLSSPFPRIRP